MASFMIPITVEEPNLHEVLSLLNQLSAQNNKFWVGEEKEFTPSHRFNKPDNVGARLLQEEKPSCHVFLGKECFKAAKEFTNRQAQIWGAESKHKFSAANINSAIGTLIKVGCVGSYRRGHHYFIKPFGINEQRHIETLWHEEDAARAKLNGSANHR